MKKICENCKKEVEEMEHYFEVKEKFKKRELSKKYVHKSCQDNHENQLKQSLQANQMAGQFIKNANQFMKEKMGMSEVVNV